MHSIHSAKLSKVTEQSNVQEKPETPEALRKLLLPRAEIQWDDISLSGSEISDAFAEIQKEICPTSANAGRRLSKQEADLLIMAQFTYDFKQTMRDTRAELQLGDNIMNESVDDIYKILDENREDKDLPESIQQRIDELLKDSEYMCSTPSQVSDDAPPTRKTSSVGCDAMSGVWRMLSMRDPKERFKTSSPSFNAFQQEEPHWLERPSVPWETIDFSKQKCEEWLHEQQS